jgi:hypothetical protein
MDGGAHTAPDVQAETRVTDAQLLTRQFTTDDPESLDNLSLDVPQTDRTPIIEFAYRGCRRCRRHVMLGMTVVTPGTPI